MLKAKEVNDYLWGLETFKKLDDLSSLQFKISNWTPSIINLEQLFPQNITETQLINFTILISNTTPIDVDQLKKYHSKLEGSETKIQKLCIEIIITIKKAELLRYFVQSDNLKNTYIFYSLDNFVTNINKDVNLNNDYYVKAYIIENNLTRISNDFLSILPLKEIESHCINELPGPVTESFKSMKVVFEDSNKIQNITSLPKFWYITSHEGLLHCFDNQFLLKTLYLISNKADMKNNTFVIKGHYSLKLKLNDVVTKKIDRAKWIELLDFVIDEDAKRHSERLLILRNVLTNYLSNSSTLDEIDSKISPIAATAWHHFELYLQNEIKIFMDQKNNLLQEAISVTDKINERNIKVNEFSQKNLILIFGLIITNFLPFSPKNELNPYLFYFSILTTLIIICLNLQTLNASKKQLQNSITKFEFYVENISSKNLKGLNVEDLKNNFIQEDELIIKNSLVTHLCIFYLLLVIIILGALFYLLFGQSI